jgi:hypothetical protein
MLAAAAQPNEERKKARTQGSCPNQLTSGLEIRLTLRRSSRSLDILTHGRMQAATAATPNFHKYSRLPAHLCGTCAAPGKSCTKATPLHLKLGVAGGFSPIGLKSFASRRRLPPLPPRRRRRHRQRRPLHGSRPTAAVAIDALVVSVLGVGIIAVNVLLVDVLAV